MKFILSRNFEYLIFFLEVWLLFWNSVFWLIFLIFFLNSNNLLMLLLYSELMWIILYIISIYFGCLNDDINLYTLSFFLLALAGLEFSFGLLIIVLFKNIKVNFNFTENKHDYNQFFNNNVKKLRINKFIWNIL